MRQVIQSRDEIRECSVLDVSQATKSLKLLFPTGVLEVRMPGRGTVSGYFTTPHVATAAVANYLKRNPPRNVYVTLNPVKSDLLARAANRLQEYAKATTADADILELRWLLVDCDPVRPAEISSSDEELEAALVTRDVIGQYLREKGIPSIRAMSGNGGHLLVPLRPHRPNAEIVGQRRAVLEGLKHRFGNDRVSVDTTVFNPARITKFYGTFAVKGDPLQERPWRRSEIEVPAEPPAPIEFGEVTKAIVSSTTSVGPYAGERPERSAPAEDGTISTRLEEELRGKSIDFHSVMKSTGTWFNFHDCPVHADPDGHHYECGVFVSNAGQFGAKCQHDVAKQWSDFRDALHLDIGRSRRLSPAQESSHATGTRDNNRPTILVSNRFMRDISDDALAALRQANSSVPRLFRRGGILVRTESKADCVLVRALNLPALRGELDRVADFIAAGKGGHVRPTRPPTDVTLDLLALPELPFPELRSIAHVPVLLPSGRFLANAGFDIESGILLDLGCLGQLDESMSPASALELLRNDLLGEFPFVGQAGLAHALALLLQPFVRLSIDGPTPLYLIDSPTPGTGKGLLADVVTLIPFGKQAAIMAEPRDDDEARKRITSLLLGGGQVILLDNIRTANSPALAAALTALFWDDRLLGQSQIVHVRNDATWIATGNNVTLSDEMARRVVPIRLDAGLEMPEQGRTFRHPKLRGWASSMRPQLVSACVSVVKAWVAAGRPDGESVLGSYEAWSAVMGGILRVAGIPGFLQDREFLAKEADRSRAEWTAFLESWQVAFGSKAVTVSDLFQLAKEREILLDVWASRSALAGQQRLGHALQARRDRVFAKWRIRSAERDAITRRAAYRLEQALPQEATSQKTFESFETSAPPLRSNHPPDVSDVPKVRSDPPRTPEEDWNNENTEDEHDF